MGTSSARFEVLPESRAGIVDSRGGPHPEEGGGSGLVEVAGKGWVAVV